MGMNDRNTIINVLNKITSDKRMLNHADYWALICGEAAELLKEDERAIKFQSDRLDELLKAQEPRLITEDDFENADECGYIPAWCEASDGIFAECITAGALKEADCKYWTSKPTIEQMKAVKWE